jgi:hypothetical protein
MTAAQSQPQQDSQKPPTQLEAFQAKTGAVIIRGYTTVGTIKGLGGNVTVQAREFRDASNAGSRVTGISIEVKETTRLERESISFIDLDEIDSLLSGIDYIAKATKTITKLDKFEAEYRTKGGLAITVFSGAGDEIKAAVFSGRVVQTETFITLADLQALRDLIVTAKSKL